jgi:hypothetical protein
MVGTGSGPLQNGVPSRQYEEQTQREATGLRKFQAVTAALGRLALDELLSIRTIPLSREFMRRIAVEQRPGSVGR